MQRLKLRIVSVPGARLGFVLAGLFWGSALAGQECGYVSTFFRGSETRDLYEARVGTIDQKNQLLEQSEHRLPVGIHELKIYELIDAPELSVDNRHRGYGKSLRVEIQPNKVYFIGAKFNSLKRFDRNLFWEPVVWQVSDQACKPD